MIFGVEFLRTQVPDLPGLPLVIYGLLLILVMVYYPKGVAGAIRALGARLQRRRQAT